MNSFPYIPTSETIISAIIKDLGIFHKDLLDKKEKSFIDLGCGYPLIPMIFSFYDFKVVGLEKSLELIKVKESCTTLRVIEMIHGNMLDFDISEYDLLFSYSPISNKAILFQAISHIVATMKSGAIFYFQKIHEWSNLIDLEKSMNVSIYPVFCSKVISY